MSLKPQNYNQFTFDDFLNDDDFIAWSLGRPAGCDWEKFLNSNPDNMDVLMEAREVILSTHQTYQNGEMSTAEVNAQWNRFRSHVSPFTRTNRPVQSSTKPAPRRFPAIAAAAAVLLAIGFWFFWTQNPGNTTYITYVTHNGEIESFYLPDSSHVFLNANSTLRVPSDFDPENIRKVELSGEAYFEVNTAHSPDNRFIIHTSLSDIHVLGTSFNLRAQSNGMRLALEEGIVDLHYPSGHQKAVKTRISPGEMASLHPDQDLDVVRLTDISRHSNWKSGYFSYADAPLSEVLIDLERQFGIHFQKMARDLNQRKLNGIVSSTDLDESISILEASLGIHITTLNDSTYSIQE